MTNLKYKPYTGIGSRQTTPDILAQMEAIGSFLAERDYTLRSGGADGADSAFERGCGEDAPREIYLPWKGFNGNASPFFLNKKDERFVKAKAIASQLHPAWDKCSHAAQMLHTRNVFQVLGWNLDRPSDFLICWTLDGKEFGGTATAIKLAKQHNVAVCNLAITSFKDFYGQL